jgi:hypothetical protein
MMEELYSLFHQFQLRLLVVSFLVTMIVGGYTLVSARGRVIETAFESSAGTSVACRGFARFAHRHTCLAIPRYLIEERLWSSLSKYCRMQTCSGS